MPPIWKMCNFFITTYISTQIIPEFQLLIPNHQVPTQNIRFIAKYAHIFNIFKTDRDIPKYMNICTVVPAGFAKICNNL